jgi:hypothetical protein
MPPREFGAILDAAFGPGAGEKAAAEYERVWQSDPRPVMYADMQPILEALPIQLRTLQQWVAEHAALFNATPVIHA